MSEENPQNIIPIALIGKVLEENHTDDLGYPAAIILNKGQDVGFYPRYVASAMIALYEAFLAHVPENIQVEFEQQVKHNFDDMFEEKDDYMITIKV